MFKKIFSLLITNSILLSALVACQGQLAEPTTTPLPATATATATVVPPTATATPPPPTATVQPTRTTVPGGIPQQAFGLQIINTNVFTGGAGKASADSGAGLIHMGIEWGWLTGNTFVPPANYGWKRFDDAITLANQLGYEVMVTLGGNPAWAAEFARGPINCPGYEDLSQYKDYVTAVVERYHDRVKLWAVYNEPDAADFVKEQPSCLNRTNYAAFGDHAEDYVRTLKLTYETVKAIDPNATVYLGGIAFDVFTVDGGYFQRDFLANVLKGGGADYVDGLNFHYYPNLDASWEKIDPSLPALTVKANTILQIMHEAGVQKPFIVTEIGASSSELYGGTPESQAGYVIKLYSRVFATGGQLGVWYNMSDYGSSGSDYFEFHGLLTANHQPKPSLTAYKVMTSMLSDAGYPTALPTDWLGNAPLEGYQYALLSSGETLYVVWRQSGESSPLQLPPGAQVWDVMGNALDPLPTTLDANPLYIRTTAQP